MIRISILSFRLLSDWRDKGLWVHAKDPFIKWPSAVSPPYSWRNNL